MLYTTTPPLKCPLFHIFLCGLLRSYLLSFLNYTFKLILSDILVLLFSINNINVLSPPAPSPKCVPKSIDNIGIPIVAIEFEIKNFSRSDLGNNITNLVNLKIL